MQALALVVAIAAAPIAAKPLPVDLTPLLGLRGGADMEASVSGLPGASADPSASFGLALDVFVRPESWFEGFIDHQTLHFSSDPAAFGTSRFDLAIDYLQFGGGYGAEEGRIRPFVSAALGLTRYGANGGHVKSTIGASGSLGGGFKVPVGKRLAFSLELRGYATATEAAVSVTCGPGCFIQFGANGWYQFALRAGLAVRL